MKFKKGNKVRVLRQIEPEIWRDGIILKSYWEKYYTIILDGSQIRVEAVEWHIKAA